MVGATQIDGVEDAILSNLIDSVVDTRERVPIKSRKSVDSLKIINHEPFLVVFILHDNDLRTPRGITRFDDSFTKQPLGFFLNKFAISEVVPA